MKKAATVKNTSTRRAATGSSVAARSEVLDAALKIFARDTFEGASLQEIAKLADIGQPLVHYHFGSKDNLWRAAAEYALADYGRFFALLGKTTIDLEPIDALRVTLRSFLEFSAERPEHMLIILNEMRTHSERFEWLLETFIRPFHALLDGLLGRAAERGQIRSIPVAHLTTTITLTLSHFHTVGPLIRSLYGVDPQDRDVANAHADYMMQLLFHGLQITPASSQKHDGELAAPQEREDERHDIP